jgi:hypothetical protein
MKCKFCGCTERRTCFIPASFISDPDLRASGNVVPCSWLIENVCTGPECVAKAYAEAWPLAEQTTAALAFEAQLLEGVA